MKKVVLWGVLALLMAVMVAGCGGEKSEESRIRSRYGTLARGVERENIGDVMMLFSTQYLDQGYDYVDVRNNFANLFDVLDDIQDSYTFDYIDVRGNYATVYGVHTLSGANTFEGGRWETQASEFTDIWRKMNGTWYLYGDQVRGHGAGASEPKPFRYSPGRMKNAVPGKK